MQINNFDNGRYSRIPNFGGLTGIMNKRISTNPNYLEQLSRVYSREQGSVGSLPKDMFELFRTTSRESNALKIKMVKEALNDANAILAGIEELKIKIARDMKPNGLINQFLPKIAKINIQPERIPRIIIEMRKRFTPDKSVLADFANRAAALLEKRFKEIGMLSETDGVKLTYLDQGKYKNTFKMQLLDKEGKDIIHPKVILSFKSQKSAMEQTNVLLGLMKTYFQNIKAKEYLEIVTNVLDHASHKVVPPEQKDIYKKSLLEIYSKVKTKNEEQKFLDLIKNATFDEIRFNGVGPESNIIRFIKHSAGHPMASSDYIDVFYLNTLNNVGLSEFSDTALPPVTKRINLYKYGLFHGDLRLNKNNVVGERVIDYGGIKPLRGMSELTQSSIVRRYYHKISQICEKSEEKTQQRRIAYWNALYRRAINGTIPNHNDVLLALEKSRSLIDDKYLELLADADTVL